jgi:hypothetical protein
MPEEKQPEIKKEEKKAEVKPEVKKEEFKPVEKAEIISAAEQKKEAGMKDVLAKAEISLLLDTYDDIFSDFDPRPYSQRSLSDDFLIEAKKITKDKVSGGIELGFLIPVSMRDLYKEATIKKRLREHFRKHSLQMEQEWKAVIKNGIYVTVVGFVLMIISTWLYSHENTNFLIQMLRIIIEPAGWFMVWFGLDRIFYTSKESRPDVDFYNKMVKAEIKFGSY